MGIGNVFKYSLKFMAYFLMPDTCLHCKKDLGFAYEKPLCKTCQEKLRKMPDLQCKRCGVVLDYGGSHCHRCIGYKASKYKCSIIRSALVFGPEIRSVIHHFKYRQKTKLSAYLGGFLINAFNRYQELSGCDLILPVALSLKKLKMRGFNQAGMLALELSKIMGIKVFPDVLIRKSYRKPQAELTRAERLENVKDAFAVTRPEIVKGKNILLIDDVSTTGSTLEACAIALKSARAKKVKALTIARE
jgi:competence protein ComFC